MFYTTGKKLIIQPKKSKKKRKRGNDSGPEKNPKGGREAPWEGWRSVTPGEVQLLFPPLHRFSSFKKFKRRKRFWDTLDPVI